MTNQIPNPKVFRKITTKEPPPGLSVYKYARRRLLDYL
jgi:hypothetical protein